MTAECVESPGDQSRAPHSRIAVQGLKVIREAGKTGPAVEDVMGLLVMILVFVLFVGGRNLPAQRELRARLIASSGEGGYKVGYALASVLGLVLIVWGFAHYRATGWIDVWYPPKAFKHITVALMLPAVILVVAAYIRGRIYTAVKHPMLAGVKLWAAAHLLANGDLGSIVLFGPFLWVGGVGRGPRPRARRFRFSGLVGFWGGGGVAPRLLPDPPRRGGPPADPGRRS